MLLDFCSLQIGQLLKILTRENLRILLSIPADSWSISNTSIYELENYFKFDSSLIFLFMADYDIDSKRD